MAVRRVSGLLLAAANLGLWPRWEHRDSVGRGNWMSRSRGLSAHKLPLQATGWSPATSPQALSRPALSRQTRWGTDWGSHHTAANVMACSASRSWSSKEVRLAEGEPGKRASGGRLWLCLLGQPCWRTDTSIPVGISWVRPALNTAWRPAPSPTSGQCPSFPPVTWGAAVSEGLPVLLCPGRTPRSSVVLSLWSRRGSAHCGQTGT